MKRRALAMLLAVMMIISLIPVTAQAACNHTPMYVVHPDLPRYHRVICSSCGEELDRETHHYVGGDCDKCGVQDPNCQHTDKQTVEHTTSCKACGKVLSETDCTHFSDGVCITCGKVLQGPVGGGSGSGTGAAPSTPSQPSAPSYGCYHNNTTYYANSAQHWEVCNDCDATVGNEENHRFGTNDRCVVCTYRNAQEDVDTDLCAHEQDAYEYIDDDTCQRYCATCGLEYGNEETEHDISVKRAVELDGTGKHERVCIDCGEPVGIEEYHTFEDGECFCGAEAVDSCGCGNTDRYYYVKSGGGHDVYCLDCGDHIRLEQHVAGDRGVWNGDKYYHNVYCDLCEGVMDIEEHNFKKNGNNTCDCGMVCGGEGSPKQHAPSDVCEEPEVGLHYVLCLDCDAHIENEHEPIVQHGNEAKKATWHARKCLVCGDKYANLPHVPVVGDPYDYGTHYVVCDDCDLPLATESHDFKKNGNSTCDCGLVCGGEGGPEHAISKDCIVNSDGTHTPVCTRCDAQLEMDMGPVKVIDNKDIENHVRYCRACKKDVEFAHTLARKVYSFTRHIVYCEECEMELYYEDHTFDATGKCTGCGYQCLHSKASTTIYANTDATHTEKCNYCKIEKLETREDHEFVNGVCSDCGFTCEHEGYTDGYTTYTYEQHTVRCGNCGKGMTNVAHTWNAKTGKCKICSQECLHANKTLSADKATETCAVCGKTSAHAHTYNSHGKCTNTACGYKCAHVNGYAQVGTTQHKLNCATCEGTSSAVACTGTVPTKKANNSAENHYLACVCGRIVDNVGEHHVFDQKGNTECVCGAVKP